MSSKSVLILFLVPSSPPRRPVHGRQPKLRLFRLPRPWQSRRLLRIGKAIEFAKIPYSFEAPISPPEIENRASPPCGGSPPGRREEIGSDRNPSPLSFLLGLSAPSVGLPGAS